MICVQRLGKAHWRSRMWRWAPLLVLAVLAVHLAWLTRMPIVFIDEAWQANAVWSWLNTGKNFELIHRGTLDQFGMEWLRRPVLGALPWLAMFGAFGTGLFQARLVSLIFGGALLALVYVSAGRLYSRGTALLATLLLSLSIPFVQAAHFARQDAMLALCAFGAFVMAFAAMRRNDTRLHFAAGLLMALSVDVHQYALLLIPGLIAMYAARYGRRLLLERGTWLAALGGVLGLAFFLAIHVLPNPQAYVRMTAFDTYGSRTPPLLTFDPKQWLMAVLGEGRLYGFKRSPLELIALIVGVCVLAMRRSPTDKLVLGYTLGALLSLTFLSGKKSDLYAIFMYPHMLLVGAEGVMTLYRRASTATLRAALTLSMAALVLFSGQRFVRTAASLASYDYSLVVRQLAESIPQGARVMGSPTWWFGFVGRDYVSTINITYYHYYNQLSFDDAIARDKLDYLIVDDMIELIAYQPGPQDVDEFAPYRVPHEGGAEAWLAANASLVSRVKDPWHGDLRVYKLNRAQYHSLSLR